MLPPREPDPAAILAVLHGWLDRRLEAGAAAWLAERVTALAAAPEDRLLYRAFSEAVMRTGKADLDLGPGDLQAADAARPGWRPIGWSVDQAARLALLLAVAGDAESFGRRLGTLIRTADVAELVTLYRGLPLYPDAASHVARATLGVRSNMKPVFEAVAHHDPFPAERFDEMAWNQMVLKALFVGSSLDPIVGLDDGGNPRLTTMLCRYAGERWAASRAVSPELWRCVGLAADDTAIDCLRRVLTEGDEAGRQAAVLALRSASADHPAALDLLASEPDLATAAADGAWTWSDLVPA